METIGRQFVTAWAYGGGWPCQTASSCSRSRRRLRKSTSKRIAGNRGCPGNSSSNRERKLSSAFASPFVYSIHTVLDMGLFSPIGANHGLSAIPSSLLHSSEGTADQCGAAPGSLDFTGCVMRVGGLGIVRTRRICSGLEKSEMSSAGFQLLASPAFQFQTSYDSSGFSLESSKQLDTPTDDFLKLSTFRSPRSPSVFPGRNSSKNSDPEPIGAPQPPGRSSSAATRVEITPGRRNSVGNRVLSKPVAECSAAKSSERRANAINSDHSRPFGTNPNLSTGFSDSMKSSPKTLAEVDPESTCQIPYFKASNAAYKAQVVQAAKTLSHKAINFSVVTPSLVGTLNPSRTVAISRTSDRQPKGNLVSSTGDLAKDGGNPVPLEASPSDSSGPSTLLNDDEYARGTNATRGWSNIAESRSPLRMSVRSSSSYLPPNASSPTSSSFSSRCHPSDSESDLLPANSSLTERRDTRRVSPHKAQSPSSPLRSSTKDSVATLSSSESLDRLHQQLKELVRENSSKAILQKPLRPEEAERLRDRLKEQKQRSMHEIRRRLLQGRQADSQGDGFTCSVEPESLILGEYVVHKRVGVGKYLGMKCEVPPGKSNPSKYIYLKYADGIAKLKAKQARRLLYRYHLSGETGRAPSLSKIKDPSLWEKRKNKGKIAIQKMVVNMMELYIHRLKQSRPPYLRNVTATAEFAAQFPFTPTPDQFQAFADVERDMTERDLPMDRLICGDVGFGKTEVALRALFIAVASGKQAMVLTPSTVLAKQHFETIQERFASFPWVKVALLCRFQKDSERKDMIVGIHDGSLRIVVGTHSLLGNQIRYHNLGLLVVDEEQRFGVKQKEKITCLKTSVDVLTLSATPIPRTLYLAMNGFRDASILATPPPERQPIQTHLMEYNEDAAKAAIHFELERGGQVFYVVPKIKGIEQLQGTLQSRFPDVKVAIAHGKQSASVLEDAMEKFCEGETKILVCTNIIESGLDIRMVNTIIVEDVHLFGLAQLYQLRGRVGRSQIEAHAYLFHPHKSILTDEALERLIALQDCCDLGQGFQLAERDMAIRGIGSLFGEQQSGDAAKIGTDLYFEMLLDGLSKVDSLHLPQLEYDDVQVELAVDAHIPSDYIKNSEERGVALRNAEGAAKESLQALMHCTNSFREDYGKEPTSVEMLLKTMYVRRMATDLGIHRVRIQHTSVMLETNMSSEAFEMIASSMPSDSIRSSVAFKSGCIEMQGLICLPDERQLERIFCCLSEMINGLPFFVKYI